MHILSMVGLNARCMQDDLEKRPTCQAKDLRISSEPYNQVLKAYRSSADPEAGDDDALCLHGVVALVLNKCSFDVWL